MLSALVNSFQTFNKAIFSPALPQADKIEKRAKSLLERAEVVIQRHYWERGGSAEEPCKRDVEWTRLTQERKRNEEMFITKTADISEWNSSLWSGRLKVKRLIKGLKQLRDRDAEHLKLIDAELSTFEISLE
ncbi:hypothetical protein T439DRAFT_348234, partial [Meredithblackwellia eburnea MCA 4105]